jgi:hypothetical protein
MKILPELDAFTVKVLLTSENECVDGLAWNIAAHVEGVTLFDQLPLRVFPCVAAQRRRCFAPSRSAIARTSA